MGFTNPSEWQRVQAEIDKLIDWYKDNKPEAGAEILVRVEPKYLKYFARPLDEEDRMFSYRGRRLRRVIEVD